MHELLLVAHGSRREASNDEIRELTASLGARSGGRFGHVSCGFLELAEPSIPAAVDAAVARGAEQVTVLPYFLSAGRHVAEDIPAALDEARHRHPGVTIRMLPYLGAQAGIVDMLLAMVDREDAPGVRGRGS